MARSHDIEVETPAEWRNRAGRRRQFNGPIRSIGAKVKKSRPRMFTLGTVPQKRLSKVLLQPQRVPTREGRHLSATGGGVESLVEAGGGSRNTYYLGICRSGSAKEMDAVGSLSSAIFAAMTLETGAKPLK